MTLQPLFFGFFKHLNTAKHNDMTIVFDHKSPFNNFGLGPWNRALDMQFWFLFPALFIPVISRMSQQPGELDFGQHIGGILLLILVWFPALLSFVSKKPWKNEIRIKSSSEGNDAIELFNKQNVWPFDGDITMRAGFVLSLIVLSMTIGTDLVSVLKGN